MTKRFDVIGPPGAAEKPNYCWVCNERYEMGDPIQLIRFGGGKDDWGKGHAQCVATSPMNAVNTTQGDDPDRVAFLADTRRWGWFVGGHLIHKDRNQRRVGFTDEVTRLYPSMRVAALEEHMAKRNCAGCDTRAR